MYTYLIHTVKKLGKGFWLAHSINLRDRLKIKVVTYPVGRISGRIPDIWKFLVGYRISGLSWIWTRYRGYQNRPYIRAILIYKKGYLCTPTHTHPHRQTHANKKLTHTPTLSHTPHTHTHTWKVRRRWSCERVWGTGLHDLLPQRQHQSDLFRPGFGFKSPFEFVAIKYSRGFAWQRKVS